MLTYFTTFIPGYSITAAPLLSQLKKDNKKLKWNEDCEKAWQEMRRKVAETPILALPKYSEPLFLHTDACKNGHAAILVQIQTGHPVIVDAISRTTTDAEKKKQTIAIYNITSDHYTYLRENLLEDWKKL